MARTTSRASTPELRAVVSRTDRRLRITAVVFAVAVLLHGADHLRRGVDSVTGLVLGAGTTQFAAGAVAVVLVFRRHRLAAAVAAVVGLASAVGFAAAHLLPQWSAWSDPFTGRAVAPHVNAFSWFTALFEITADLAFGVAGLQLFRARTGDASGSAARARGRIAGVGPGIPS